MVTWISSLLTPGISAWTMYVLSSSVTSILIAAGPWRPALSTRTGLKNELAATEDWVLADILGDLDIAMVTRDIQELQEIEAALARIEDGSYGTCRDCGEPIGWPRLNAQPTAMRCIACQGAFETAR